MDEPLRLLSEAIAAQKQAQARFNAAEKELNNAKRAVCAAEVKCNAVSIANGTHPVYRGDYMEDTGRYREAWRHLVDALVPDYGEASTDAGEVLRRFDHLTYRYLNDGDIPQQYFDEKGGYFSDGKVSENDMALHAAPEDAEFDIDTFATWVEEFLETFLCNYGNALPKYILPLPGSVPPDYAHLARESASRKKQRVV